MRDFSFRSSTTRGYDLSLAAVEAATQLAVALKRWFAVDAGTDLGLADGAAGLAVALHYAAKVTSDREMARVSGEYLRRATAGPAHDASLMSGSAGALLANVVIRDAEGGGSTTRDSYGVLHADGDRLRQVASACAASVAATAARPLTCSAQYDFISGFCGTAYAVGRYGDIGGVKDVLSATFRNRRFSGWTLGYARGRCVFSLGLGIAHGLPGVLAAMLSLGTEHDDIARIANLVENEVTAGRCDVFWPAHKTAGGYLPGRAGWCNGTPGTAMLLHAAAFELGDLAIQRRCEDAVVALARLDLAFWDLDCLGLCHGLAGAVALLSLADAAMPDRVVGAAKRRLLARLLMQLRAGGRPLGSDGKVAEPGFLNGAAGIVLALFYAAGAIDSRWLQLLGLPCCMRLGR